MSGSVVLFGGAGVLGLAIALLLAAFLPGRSGQRGVAHALTAIERRYAQAPAAAAPGADPLGALPGWTGSLAARLSPSGIASSLQRRLDIAGNPRRWTPDRMLAVKGAGLLTLAVLGGLCGLRSPGLLILGIAGGGAAGFFVPDLLLFNAGQKRQAKLRQGLPDALDMLTVCVEAGLWLRRRAQPGGQERRGTGGRRVRPRAPGDADRQDPHPGPSVGGGPDHGPRAAVVCLRPGPGQ